VCGLLRVALFRWRGFVSLIVLAFLPVSLFADGSAAAVLRSTSGTVFVNQSAAPSSIAVFRGDLIETRSNSSAWMEYRGSSVQIDPETIIRLEDGEIILDHGSVTVTSYQQLRVRAGCILATPVESDKTTYFVKDTDGRVTVFAQEKDVNLDSHSSKLKRASQAETSGHDVVHQSQQKSRDEHCGAADLRPDGITSPILDSPWVVAPAAAVVVGGTLCVLLCFDDEPPSPSSPSKSSVTANHP
jgi:hypothetical protein